MHAQPVEQLVGRLIRQDDHLEAVSELPRHAPRVDDRHVGHFHVSNTQRVHPSSIGAAYERTARSAAPRPRQARRRGTRAGGSTGRRGRCGASRAPRPQSPPSATAARVGRDVVRGEWRPAWVQPEVRVALRLKQRLGEPGVRLPQHHDVAPGREPLPPSATGGARCESRPGHDAGCRAAQRAPRNLMLSGQDVGIRQPFHPGRRALRPSGSSRASGRDSGPRSRQGVGSVGLVGHDVAQGPTPPGRDS